MFLQKDLNLYVLKLEFLYYEKKNKTEKHNKRWFSRNVHHRTRSDLML